MHRTLIRDDDTAVKMVILTMKNYQSWLSNQKIRCSSPKEGLHTSGGPWTSAVETDPVEEAEANS